jgi:DAK2 domain fusion protein YloV
LANSADVLTVSQARAFVAAGFEALEERKQEINDLNVYPVPDGDTGTNLSLTLRGVRDALNKLSPSLGQGELCNAIAQAALMGARGNSGVILSQIVRGAMEVLGRSGPMTSAAIAHSLRHATDTAYRAVRKPVEGTMLTVLRDMAEAAERLVGDEGDVESHGLLEAVIAEGWRSVERTPSLLRVLADAGVVDAGGFGLVVLLEGIAKGGRGTVVPIETHVERGPSVGDVLLAEEEEEGSAYGYCTSFLLTGHEVDKDRLEDELSRLGDSLLVVGGGGQVKVHVHTDDPGRVLSIGTSLGVLSEIEIDNMAEQAEARARRLAENDGLPADPGLTQVVAVVAGEGNKRLFRNLGVDFIVDGGQSMNPSTEDLMRAISKAKAPSVIILPNNGNVIMTADQTTRLSDKNVLVVPSRSVQAGLMAAVVYDRRNEGEVNAREMRAALQGVVTADITQAVRDSLVDGVQVRARDFIGLIDDRVVVAAADLGSALDDVLARLLDGGREILTALVGEGDQAEEARALLERLRLDHPEVEIEVHDGGQPFYPVLLAAE